MCWSFYATGDEKLAQRDVLQKLGTLRRRETTVTSEGRHREYSPRSAGGGGKRKREDHDLRSGRQKGLRHVEDVKRGEFLDDVNGRSGGTSSGSEGTEAAGVAGARARLAQFR